jgi:DNA-binding NtrC family response regulator
MYTPLYFARIKDIFYKIWGHSKGLRGNNLEARDQTIACIIRGKNTMSNGTVLIIDDEANLRTTMAAILERAGYSVSTAPGIQLAMQCLNEQPFDLLFLDLRMPDMDGLDALPQIHSRWPELPILILTAVISLEKASQAMELGARGYLLKPIDPAQILKRVADILEEQRYNKLCREISNEIQELFLQMKHIQN